MWFLENAWLIPVLPAVAFWIILLFGKRTQRATNGGAYIGIAAIAASLVLSLATAYQWTQRVHDAEGGGHGAFALLGSVGRSIARQAEEGHEASAYTEPVIKTWTWWQAGGVEFSIGTHIDGLAVALLVAVCIISLLVQVYSLEYVRGDRRFTHYYAALSLFTAGMLNLVVAQNTLQLILGWEIMGLCSFMLIGHWWEEQKNSDAALKAFFTTRTGDIGLLVGVSILFWGAGSFDIQAINEWAVSGDWDKTVIFWAALSLLIAIIGKSGQFPLHTWLPDAMAGPTPVSALIHAATMVVAGVYLGARLYPVFYEGFDIADTVANPMAVIGAITIIIAAVLAFVQVDIKKVLAYSTVSQLGYMVMGLGVGAWTPAVFHIFTHAFFKGLLFLGAGSVSHSGAHHSFDMKKDMGGLRKYMPITFWTFIIGTLALAGIFPLAGFFSKDEILANAGNNGYEAFMIVGLVGAFLTAAYMTRCVYLVFFGEYRGGHAHAHAPEPELVPAMVAAAEMDTRATGDTGGMAEEDPYDLTQLAEREATDPTFAREVAYEERVGVPAGVATAVREEHLEEEAADLHDGHGAHDVHGAHAVHGAHGHDDHGGEPHESPALITVPLLVLAFLSVTAGFLNALPFNIELFTEWVETSPLGASFPELTHAPFHWSEGGLSIAIAVAGIIVSAVICRALYERHFLEGLTRRNVFARAGYTFLWNKYYLDHLYENIIVAGIKGPIARVANWINKWVLDGAVNGVGITARVTGEWTYKYLDQKVVDGIVNGSGIGAEESGQALRPIQSGRVQQYGALLFGAAALGALVLVITVGA